MKTWRVRNWGDPKHQEPLTPEQAAAIEAEDARRKAHEALPIADVTRAAVEVERRWFRCKVRRSMPTTEQEGREELRRAKVARAGGLYAQRCHAMWLEEEPSCTT